MMCGEQEEENLSVTNHCLFVKKNIDDTWGGGNISGRKIRPIRKKNRIFRSPIYWVCCSPTCKKGTRAAEEILEILWPIQIQTRYTSSFPSTQKWSQPLFSLTHSKKSLYLWSDADPFLSGAMPIASDWYSQWQCSILRRERYLSYSPKKRHRMENKRGISILLEIW